MKRGPHGSKAGLDAAPSGFMSRLKQTLHLLVHIPDYDTYVRTLKETQPDAPIPTQEQFIYMCQERRFRQDYLIGKC